MKFKICIFSLMLVLVSTFNYAQASSLKELENTLTKHEGKVIYVDFWASWCIPCKRSFPWMNEMTQKHSPEHFKVVTINLDVDIEDALDFLNKYPATFDVIYDPKADIAKKFELKGMPSSFIINKAGKIVSAHTGFTEEKKKQYEQEIEQLLKATD